MADERDGISISSPDLSEFIPHLSCSTAVKLLEIIHQSVSCNTEKDFINLFPKIQELIPFDFAVGLIGDLERSGFVTDSAVDVSFPDEFSQIYASNNYIQRDCLVKEFARTRKVQYWPNGWEKLGQRNEIISLCMDTNVKTGFIHGSKQAAPTKNCSLISFAGPAMPYDERTIALIDLLVPHLHISLSQIFSRKIPLNDREVELSCRELEILNWLKHGKSSWEMSVILGISERTVNFHVYNIMEKLDVVNRPQAVAVATRLGLIEIE